MPTKDQDFRAGDRIVWRFTRPDCWIRAHEEGVIERKTRRGFILKMDSSVLRMSCLPSMFDKVPKKRANAVQ